MEAPGKTPYVRCLHGPEPDERAFTVGGTKLAVQGRVLTVSAARASVRLAVFSGPGFGPPLSAAAREALGKADVDLFVMLGGLGNDAVSALASLKQLAKLDAPLLFVAGGRDRFPVIEQAFEGVEDVPRIINATPLREIRISSNTLLPIAGAEGGRYAVDSAACGFGESDLSAIAAELGKAEGGQRRHLISWHAPAAPVGEVGVTRVPGGHDTGGFALGRFALQVGASTALSAWPAVQASRPGLDAAGTLTRLVVPRLWGPRLERADGTRPDPGYALIELGQAGAQLLQ